MKQILFLIFVINTFVTKAQSFEGGYMLPGFAKEAPIWPVDLTGKLIGCADYAPFKKIDAPMLSKNEALNFALMLIRAPKELRLRRDVLNIIRSSGGYVTIFFSKTKETWALNFHPGEDIAAAGEFPLRCFYLQ